MNLNDIKKSCEAEASIIKVECLDENGNKIVKGYQDLTKKELADGFCHWDEIEDMTKDENEKAKAEILRSAYWAALLLRYWFKIFDWMKTSGSLGLRDIDFFDWLHDSLRDAFIYRSWRKLRRKYPKHHNGEWIENPDYVEDENAVDKSINYFCSARRGKEYQAANKDRRRANYQSLSIDQTFDEDGYSILDREGLSTPGKTFDGVKELVKLFLDKNKFIEALIIDNMAYGDSYKVTKAKKTQIIKETNMETNQEEEVEVSYNTFTYQPNTRKLVKSLTEIDDNYFNEYFNKQYKITDYKPILDSIKGLTNAKLYKEIEKTICTIKDSPELLAYLGQK